MWYDSTANELTARINGANVALGAGGGGGTPGNPTALVGLTAVNGSASTYLRSDGAPALDVGISPTWTGNHTFANTGFRVKESGGGADLLTLTPGSVLSANRTFTIITGDADRILTLSGNPTLADWFDQSVKTTATPQFGNIGIGTAARQRNQAAVVGRTQTIGTAPDPIDALGFAERIDIEQHFPLW